MSDNQLNTIKENLSSFARDHEEKKEKLNVAINTITAIQNNVQNSAKKLEDDLKDQVSKISQFKCKDNEMKKMENAILNLTNSLNGQLTDIHKNLLDFQKEVIGIIRPMEERISNLEVKREEKDRNQSFLPSKIEYKDEGDEDCDDPLFVDSRVINIPNFTSEPYEKEGKTVLYALVTRGPALAFKEITKKEVQGEDLGAYRAFFCKKFNDDGDYSYEVVRKTKDFKMELFLKNKLQSIKRSFKENGGTNGNTVNHFFVMKFSDTQIQFSKRIDTRFDKFGLPNYYVETEPDRFSIYVPSDKDRNQKVKIENPTKDGQKNKQNNGVSKQEVISWVREAMNPKKNNNKGGYKNNYFYRNKNNKNFNKPSNNNFNGNGNRGNFQNFNQRKGNFNNRNGNNRGPYQGNLNQFMQNMNGVMMSLNDNIRGLRNAQERGYNGRPFQYNPYY